MLPQIISDAVLSCLPFFIVVAGILYKIFMLRLPDKQAQSLRMFSEYAVQAVEQANQNSAGTQKKSLAIEIIQDLFHEFGLPVPGVKTLNTAIENAVYLMNHNPLPPPISSSAQGASMDENPLARQAINA
jgi:LL-H family phage holin